MHSTLEAALRRILAPLVRLMIARGLRFTELIDLLKALYIEQAEAHFRLDRRRMTDSRVSVLTGLQRKDIRRLRTAAADRGPTDSGSSGPLPRILACWAGSAGWSDTDGRPLVLPRKAAAGRSFEALVAEISRDIHPRTVLDQLAAAGAVRHDPETDRVTLLSEAYVARDDAGLLGYLGANLGDHAEAATGNLMAERPPAPFFERAVHYNQLSDESVETLDSMARKNQEEALTALNRTAQRLQEDDRRHGQATGRFRCGVFIYRADTRAEE